jgi:hypothetical protein
VPPSASLLPRGPRATARRALRQSFIERQAGCMAALRQAEISLDGLPNIPIL